MTTKVKKPKTIERELNIADAVSEAFGEFEALSEELRSWYDNMPAGPQGGDKGSQVDEAASAFENMSEPDVPAELADLPAFKFTVMKLRGTSRATRRDEAVMTLDALVTHLVELRDDDKQSEDVREAAGSLCDEVEQAKDDADGVEFPGMFG